MIKSKKPRKIAKQTRSKVTVSSILEASARILSRDGLKDFSTNQIARLAGVGIGSLYEYFPNKFSIIRKLAEKRIDRELEVIRQKLDELSALPLEDSVPQFVEALIALYEPNPKIDVILLENLYVVGMSEYMQEARDKVVGWLAEMLQNEKYGLKIEDPQYSAFIAVHSLHAIIHSAVAKDPQLLSNSKFKREISKLLLGYFKGSN